MTNPFTSLGMKIMGGLQILSLGFIVFLLLAKAGETRRADKLQVRVTETQAAFDKTVSDYRRVRAEQKAKDAEHARKVEAAQAKTSQEVSNDYQKRLADLRARYDRLRTGASSPNPGSGGSSPVPSLPSTAGRSDDPTAFNCEADAIQLDSLQQWLRDQLAIPR